MLWGPFITSYSGPSPIINDRLIGSGSIYIFQPPRRLNPSVRAPCKGYPPPLHYSGTLYNSNLSHSETYGDIYFCISISSVAARKSAVFLSCSFSRRTERCKPSLTSHSPPELSWPSKLWLRRSDSMKQSQIPGIVHRFRPEVYSIAVLARISSHIQWFNSWGTIEDSRQQDCSPAKTSNQDLHESFSQNLQRDTLLRIRGSLNPQSVRSEGHISALSSGGLVSSCRCHSKTF